MPASDFPNHVKEFLARNIDSLAELEALLCLRRHAPEAMRAEAIARDIQSDAISLQECLRSLIRKGFALSKEEGGVTEYSFNPDSKSAPVVDILGTLYQQGWRLAITNVIYSKISPRVQAFSDAFDMRKKRDE